MGAKQKKFYTVWSGNKTGVFNSWKECEKQIKGVAGAKFKSFEDEAEAHEAFKKDYNKFIGKTLVSKKPKPQSWLKLPIEHNSFAVDAACSGNPGKMEYRGVHILSGKEMFKKGPYPDATNNIGEFLALVHILAYCQKHKYDDITIYTDSKIAMGWIKAKKARSKVARTARNGEVFSLLERAEQWLANNTWKNPIVKWETKQWGEIPADFGRK